MDCWRHSSNQYCTHHTRLLPWRVVANMYAWRNRSQRRFSCTIQGMRGVVGGALYPETRDIGSEATYTDILRDFRSQLRRDGIGETLCGKCEVAWCTYKKEYWLCFARHCPNVTTLLYWIASCFQDASKDLEKSVKQCYVWREMCFTFFLPTYTCFVYDPPPNAQSSFLKNILTRRRHALLSLFLASLNGVFYCRHLKNLV